MLLLDLAQAKRSLWVISRPEQVQQAITGLPPCVDDTLLARFFSILQVGRLRPCVRPVCAMRASLAFMHSARSVPYRKHALSALGGNWVSLIRDGRPLIA